MSRAYTNQLIELCDNEILSKEQVFDEFMQYLSEEEIKEFCLNAFACEIAEEFKIFEWFLT